MAKINIHIRLNTSSPVSNYLTGMDRIDRIKNGRGSHPGGPLAFNRDGQDEQVFPDSRIHVPALRDETVFACFHALSFIPSIISSGGWMQGGT